mgnify:CR=1 FL=1
MVLLLYQELVLGVLLGVGWTGLDARRLCVELGLGPDFFVWCSPPVRSPDWEVAFFWDAQTLTSNTGMPIIALSCRNRVASHSSVARTLTGRADSRPQLGPVTCSADLIAVRRRCGI